MLNPERSGVDASEIDVILGIGEEHKEYRLTTSGIYIQEQIGARQAWAIDIQQRCNTAVAGLKITKDMLIADPDVETVLIVGGYRNGDLIDFKDPTTSFMYNLGAGAVLSSLLRSSLKRCWPACVPTEIRLSPSSTLSI